MCSDLHNVVRESKGKVLLSVRVQPRSRQNVLVGFRDKSLQIKVNAPPIDGAANEAVIDVLSKALRLRKSTFTVLQGAKSRDKSVKVEGITADDLLMLLEKYF
ncbi:MAG: DUF167 domain-containing protein [Abditibacteriaceae bacterium]